ncbi:MAG: SPOR domain-containing protein, partial [Acidiferrobacterales bacterium]
PLRDVTYEPNSDEGDRIILRFRRTVKYKLRRGRDGRSIIVLVAIKQPKDRETGGVNENYPYALNLESQRNVITRAKPLPRKLRNLRLYVSQYSKSGSRWHRLRLGFFPNKKSAQKALALVRKRYPRAWVARTSRSERKTSRKFVFSGRTLKGKLTVSPVGKKASVAKQMRAGRNALIRGDNKVAIVIFKRIVNGRANKYRRDALELLGLAYERDGNLTRARKNYRFYLRKYPHGKNAVRVQQRIASLSRYKGRKPLRAAKRRRRAGELQYYGTWSQRLYVGTSSAAGTSSIDQTTLNSNLYLNARAKTKYFKFRANLNADHAWDFLNSTSNKGSMRTVYAEVKGNSEKFYSKAGRQSGNARGVLSRFDGVSAGVGMYSDGYLHGVVGTPVDKIAPSSKREFKGVSVDMRIPSKDLSLTLFGINNYIDGIADRKGVGVEARYFNSDSSGFGLLDYDRYFNELNILLVQGNWKSTKKRTYNFLIDYRKSPSLHTSNALFGLVNGSAYSSIADLRTAQPGVDIYQLAKDRTATSRLISGGVTQSLSTRLQLSADLSLNDVSGLPASAGQPAVPATGVLATLSGRVIATNWLIKNSVTVAGASLTSAGSYRAVSLFVTERARFKRVWRTDVNLRLYLVQNDNGTSQARLTPVVKFEYRRGHKTFEIELGRESVENTGPPPNNSTERTFIVAGYRIDF